MRAIAFDLGDARIGVAISDTLKILASGYETYVRAKNDEERDLSYLCRLIKEKECDTIVVGLAVNLDGTEGERAETYRAFGEKLRERTGLDVAYQDEKLTTFEAEEMLKERGLSRAERKKIIDRTAACIILQEYLDKQNRNNVVRSNDMSDEMEKKHGCASRDCDEGCKEDCKENCDCGEECKENCDCGEECDCCEDEEDEIITLTDDDGEDIDFYQVATLDYKEKWYTFLEPVDPPEEMEPGDLIVFELGEDENGEDVFLPVEEEVLLDELFAEFEKLLNEEEESEGNDE